MAGLTKEALLALKPKVEAVEAPELGEGVVLYVREMNASGVLDYGALHSDLADVQGNVAPSKHRPLMAFLIERTLCDEDGQRLLEDGEFARAEIPWAVAQRVWGQAARLNQLNDSTTEASKKSSAKSQTSPSLAA